MSEVDDSVASLLADIELSPTIGEGCCSLNDVEAAAGFVVGGGSRNDDDVDDGTSLVDSLDLYELSLSPSIDHDELLPSAGPPPASVAFPSLALVDAQRYNVLAQVDYAKVSIEETTLSKEVVALCHGALGRQADLFVKYEMPPLTSAPDISGPVAARIEEDGRVTVTVGKVLDIFHLPSSERSKKRGKANATVKTRRGKRTMPASAKPSKQGMGRSTDTRTAGGPIKTKLGHSTILAIGFVEDKDVREWLEGKLCFHLVCGIAHDDCASASSQVCIASGSLQLRDVFASHLLDMRAIVDLKAAEGPDSADSASLGCVAVRLTLIGGSIQTESIALGQGRGLFPEPMYTSLPIAEASSIPPTRSISTSERNAAPSPLMPWHHLASGEAECRSGGDRSDVPQQRLVVPCGGSICHQPTRTVQSSIQLHKAPDADEVASRLECKPTMHPSGTRMYLERRYHSALRIQCWFRGCISSRKAIYSDHEESTPAPQVSDSTAFVETSGYADAQTDLESPSPPPPPLLSSPLEEPISAGSETNSFISRPDNPRQGEGASPVLEHEDSVQTGTSNTGEPPSRSFSIRLGSAKGLKEAVYLWYDQEPRSFQLCGTPVSPSGIIVSYTIFEGFSGLERNVISKVVPLRSSTYVFDSEETFSVPELNEDANMFLQHMTVEFKLFFVPSLMWNDQSPPHNTHRVCSATLPLKCLFHHEGGCRQNVPFKLQGWEETIGSLEVTLVRERVSIEQLGLDLSAASEDILSKFLCGDSSSIAALSLDLDWIEHGRDNVSERHGEEAIAAEPRESSSEAIINDGATNLLSPAPPVSIQAPEEAEEEDTSTSTDDEERSMQSLSGMMNSLDCVKTRLLESFDRSSTQTSATSSEQDSSGCTATASATSIAVDASTSSELRLRASSQDEEKEEPVTKPSEVFVEPERIIRESVDVGTSPIVVESPLSSRVNSIEEDKGCCWEEDSSAVKISGSQTDAAAEASNQSPAEASVEGGNGASRMRASLDSDDDDTGISTTSTGDDSSSPCTPTTMHISGATNRETIASTSARRRLQRNDDAAFTRTRLSARTSTSCSIRDATGMASRFSLSDTDRISSIMSSYLRPSLRPRLGGRALYSSSSSSSSDDDI